MQLLFVYNARSGKLNALFDSVHKIMSPSTYSCRLCTLTHGVFQERSLWKDFRENSGIEMLFFHRDEFLQKYGEVLEAKFSYPVILRKTEERLEVFMTKEELNALSSETELIKRINARIKTL